MPQLGFPCIGKCDMLMSVVQAYPQVVLINCTKSRIPISAANKIIFVFLSQCEIQMAIMLAQRKIAISIKKYG